MNDSDNDALRRENQELREKLAKATAEAEKYRASTRELLEEIFPDVPTEEELRAAMEPDEGETLVEMLAAYKRELEG